MREENSVKVPCWLACQSRMCILAGICCPSAALLTSRLSERSLTCGPLHMHHEGRSKGKHSCGYRLWLCYLARAFPPEIKVFCRGLFATHYHRLSEEYADDDHVALRHMACHITPSVEPNGTEQVSFSRQKCSPHFCDPNTSSSVEHTSST